MHFPDRDELTARCAFPLRNCAATPIVCAATAMAFGARQPQIPVAAGAGGVVLLFVPGIAMYICRRLRHFDPLTEIGSQGDAPPLADTGTLPLDEKAAAGAWDEASAEHIARAVARQRYRRRR